MDANFIALIVLALWGPITLYAFKRTTVVRAVAFGVFGGVLLMPNHAAIKLPAITAFTKQTFIAVWAVVGLFMVAKVRYVSPWRGRGKWFLVAVVGGIGTGLTNGEVQIFGPRVVPGIGLYDSYHMILADVLQVLMPFWAGAIVATSAARLQEMLRLLAFYLLLYSVFVIAELRLSPVFHRWVYGVNAFEDFSMAMRGGGYRPNVFLSHGLELAILQFCGVMSAAVHAKLDLVIWEKLKRPRLTFAWFFGVQVLVKSLGGLVFATVGSILIWFFRPKMQLRVAAAVALIVMAYPALRLNHMIPDKEIVEFVREHTNEERAGSLNFRFTNEQSLVDKSMRKLWFGWGQYSRAVLFDPVSGDELSVRDGAWIITLGERGLLGFVGIFGLLVFPVIVAYRRLKHAHDPRLKRLIGALAIIVAFATLDLVPNGMFNTLAFFFAGLLDGVNENVLRPGRRA
ncbi:MAG TPA: hypothetical protein RMH85_23245 [Polyangiaceae bacterium LLY-WYZ-15_(1-7)]|nr:hypothetical protein [Myxococcales bacterium]MAT26806.1 hypothetical protein [Sandaracinus sp.]HJK95216.1 hypothetical protein [Polyangiaceae bacterium LLY-WYZ-15_(1-7)]MBJ74485.1 hypothetical protein [Sandaracinus sp.]HJK99885.1 hypothetical protein [Polyangiaceae bacterium LLY-WYZ-15_(1-7)]